MAEAQVCRASAERQNLLGKRAAEIGGVAPGVEAAKFMVHCTFGVADTGAVADDQRSVHRDDRAAVSGLHLDPTQNLVRIFQPAQASEMQILTADSDRGQAARLAIPAQVDSQKDDIGDLAHVRGISSTGLPTATRPGVTM